MHRSPLSYEARLPWENKLKDRIVQISERGLEKLLRDNFVRLALKFLDDPYPYGCELIREREDTPENREEDARNKLKEADIRKKWSSERWGTVPRSRIAPKIGKDYLLESVLGEVNENGDLITAPLGAVKILYNPRSVNNKLRCKYLSKSFTLKWNLVQKDGISAIIGRPDGVMFTYLWIYRRVLEMGDDTIGFYTPSQEGGYQESENDGVLVADRDMTEMRARMAQLLDESGMPLVTHVEPEDARGGAGE